MNNRSDGALSPEKDYIRCDQLPILLKGYAQDLADGNIEWVNAKLLQLAEELDVKKLR